MQVTWIRRIIGCAGLVLAGWLAFSAKPTPALPSAALASVSNHSASLGDTNTASGILSGKAIEEIRVGDRVAAYNPEVTDSERAGWVEPDAATWEVIDLEMPKRDGGLLEISLLRPKSWLADQQATVGSEVYLDSRELNAIGNAKVIAIRPCPTIESGSGRVVVGTFKHNSSDIVDISVSSQTSPIGTTSDHPFWSRDRQAFVPAAKLLPGEKLLSIDGATLQVTAVTPRATQSAVYNLEIQGEHAYAVSENGVVVHNSGYGKTPNAVDDVGDAALDPYMKRLSDWAKSPANPANVKSVAPKTPAQRLADKARGLSNSRRPRVVAVIEHADGTVTVVRNRGGVVNDTIQAQLKDLPNTFDGQCAEVNALSRAANKGRSLEGARNSVAEVWSKLDPKLRHGLPKKPHLTCEPLLKKNGVAYYE